MFHDNKIIKRTYNIINLCDILVIMIYDYTFLTAILRSTRERIRYAMLITAFNDLYSGSLLSLFKHSLCFLVVNCSAIQRCPPECFREGNSAPITSRNEFLSSWIGV